MGDAAATTDWLVLFAAVNHRQLQQEQGHADVAVQLLDLGSAVQCLHTPGRLPRALGLPDSEASAVPAEVWCQRALVVMSLVQDSIATVLSSWQGSRAHTEQCVAAMLPELSAKDALPPGESALGVTVALVVELLDIHRELASGFNAAAGHRSVGILPPLPLPAALQLLHFTHEHLGQVRKGYIIPLDIAAYAVSLACAAKPAAQDKLVPDAAAVQQQFGAAAWAVHAAATLAAGMGWELPYDSAAVDSLEQALQAALSSAACPSHVSCQ